MLDQLSKQKEGRTATQQKIGDFFGACMDEAAVEKLGAGPIKPLLARIAAMKSTNVGGLILAWMAWKMETANKRLAPVDDLTPEQRFFVGYAQWACGSERPESLRVKALTDPHSPPKYRVNGLMVNMPEFQQAFQCKAGQPMAPEKRCRVW